MKPARAPRAGLFFAFAATVASAVVPTVWAAGERDPTFGDHGRVVDPSAGASVDLGAVVTDRGGRIVVVGTRNGTKFGSPRMFLARYTSRGMADQSFAGGGYATPTFLNGDDWSGGGDVLAIADGGLLAGGTVSSGPDAQSMLALARYDAAGSSDTTFDGDGAVTTAFGTANAHLDALVVDTAGRYVAAGFASSGGNDSIAIARYRGDGSLDPALAGSGELTTQLPGSCAQAFSAAVQRNNKIVVAGRAGSCGGRPHALVVRYTVDGHLDESFGGDGIVTARIGAETVATALVLDGRERPVVAVNSSRGPRLLRFTRSGSRDLGFGRRGTTRLPTKVTSDAAILDLVRQPDGRLLAAGTTVRGRRRFLLLRFGRNGGIDRSFGLDGRATVGFPRTASASALALQGARRAVVGGTIGDYTEELALARVRTGTAQ